MNPVDPMHWSNLAKAQEKLGAASEAAESLSRAKSLHAAAVSSSGRLESPPTSSSRSSRGDGKGSRRKRKDASSNTQAPQKVRRRKQSPLRDVKTIIEEAIAVAEGGDLESALELFQEVWKLCTRISSRSNGHVASVFAGKFLWSFKSALVVISFIVAA